MPNFIVLDIKMWIYSLKNREKSQFWYKFAHKWKFRRSTKKLEYRCTTTNFPLCTDTIIVLKITLFHSVSVITNFVIPKHDKKNRQTDKKHHTFLSSARLGMVKRSASFLHSANFFDPISSFAARGYWKFVGKCPHRGKMLIT